MRSIMTVPVLISLLLAGTILATAGGLSAENLSNGEGLPAKGFSLAADMGATKLVGGTYEDNDFRPAFGVGFYYSFNSIFQAGIRAGYTRWTPTSITDPIVGVSRKLEGSLDAADVAFLARLCVPYTSDYRLRMFIGAGAGICFINSGLDVYARPVVPDPGPYVYEYSAESESGFMLTGRIGFLFRLKGRAGIEASAAYSHVFTEDDATKYVILSTGMTFDF